MSPLVFYLVVGSLVVALLLDMVVWRRAVNREFQRRGLRRSPTHKITALIDPAFGWHVMETCVCEQEGQLVEVTVLGHRKSRELSVTVRPYKVPD